MPPIWSVQAVVALFVAVVVAVVVEVAVIVVPFRSGAESAGQGTRA